MGMWKGIWQASNNATKMGISLWHKQRQAITTGYNWWDMMRLVYTHWQSLTLIFFVYRENLQQHRFWACLKMGIRIDMPVFMRKAIIDNHMSSFSKPKAARPMSWGFLPCWILKVHVNINHWEDARKLWVGMVPGLWWRIAFYVCFVQCPVCVISDGQVSLGKHGWISWRSLTWIDWS